MRIALDLEEVLADTISEACRSTDKLEPTDFDTWDIDGYVWQVYAGVSDALWRHDPLSIPPVEPNLSEYTQAIGEGNTLDIVTARLHVDEYVQLWLDEHNIYYDNILSTKQPKYELDYDEWIDDNPSMIGMCNLTLRHHAHNAHIDVSDIDSCTRVHTLAERV